jgi:adenylate cyclase
VAVKGKREGVEIFELLGRREAAAPRPAFVARYEQALDAYFARRFDDALAILDGCADDAPSRVLAERCRHFRVEGPPADWDGIYVAKDK